VQVTGVRAERLVIGLAAGATVFVADVSRSASVAATGQAAVATADLTAVRVHRYTMSAAVRPLLFWISRDRVGFARITWLRGGDGTLGYELLVGTDPAQAPRGINRWGYIAEAVRGEDGSVLALMTGSPDTSYSKEEASSTGTGRSPAEFRAVRGAVHQGRSTWQSLRIRPPTVLTIHDLGEALGRVDGQMAGVVPRDGIAPAGSRSGFLVSVADAIDRTVGGRSESDSSSKGGARSSVYVFGRDTYELCLRDASATTVSHAGRQTPATRLRFESRRLDSGSRTQFEVIAGTAGDLRGVPLVIEWQPRWWLRATLRLQEG
jgi:hypothetical protein